MGSARTETVFGVCGSPVAARHLSASVAMADNIDVVVWHGGVVERAIGVVIVIDMDVIVIVVPVPRSIIGVVVRIVAPVVGR